MLNLYTLKLIGIALVAIAITGALYMVDSWRKDSARLDVVETEYKNYQDGVTNALKLAEKQRLADEQARTRLASDVAGVDSKLSELAKRPIQTVNHYETIMPDGTVCPADRLSDDYRVMYNDIASVTLDTP